MTIQIKDILNELILRRPEFKKKVREAESFLVWDEVLKSDILKNTRPSRIRDGVLFVETTTSSWANELNFLKSDIISKINGRLGDAVIKDIYFHTGKGKATT